MSKLTKQELDERIDMLSDRSALHGYIDKDDAKQLIRDCIEAVTPEHKTIPYSPDFTQQPNSARIEGYNSAIDTIQANSKELLGGR